MPAAYLASKFNGIRFYAYMFDDYTYQWMWPTERFFARIVESIVIKQCAGVITANEFLQDEYRRRHHVEPTVIHNPIEIFARQAENTCPWPSSREGITIVYTGSIYFAHYDAFRNLVKAIDMLGRSDVQLHIYTAEPWSVLERAGICGPIVLHSHLSPAEVQSAQRQADILFLPLAFESPIPKVIRTSAPAKMGEYLASGRPVLVHAPPDAFVSWYFREHECGFVVDKNDPSVLAATIADVIAQPGCREGFARNAVARAEADFNRQAAQARFLKLVWAQGTDR